MQYAKQLSGLPGGLSEAITRHLERQMGLAPGPVPHTGSANDTPPPLASLASPPVPTRIPQAGAAGFVQQHDGAARRAEAATGIPAAFMLAQAAHETGWGRREIRHADGSPAFNLFGVKAGAGWRGPVAEVTTTEYVNGTPHKTVAAFRAYGSYAESFADYARLMRDSPRYSGVVARVSALASASKETEAAAGFAQGLQRAGYATDPAYAEKLGRAINTTLRLQRSLD
ncbi:MAG TPA: flagellar assembly peptidoglycan hydrolase FlgJ, partial [Rubrivivax sp.]|nr:flagellar assembly peptidoglycan hydrolase FlgJ [Rubrivivax sp.]